LPSSQCGEREDFGTADGGGYVNQKSNQLLQSKWFVLTESNHQDLFCHYHFSHCISIVLTLWWLASRQKEKNQRVHTSLLVAYAPFLPTTSHSSSWPFCCKHPEGSQVCPAKRLAKRPPCDDDTLSFTPPKSRKCKATENTKLESNKYKIKER